MAATVAARTTDSPTVGASQPDPDSASASRPSLPNYQWAELIGAGGMGEVILAHDVRIGRDIAIKRMRGATATPEALERFVREARIQARLEHPAIVPVYEIGTAPDGSPFFAMKRVVGTTLAALIASAPDALQRLLRVFVEVCQAVEFAHAHGVVHRDLKPLNVIVGELGEVYVLDWGVARVLGDGDTAAPGDIYSLDGSTQAGATLGTPGYMAPEQVRDAATVGAPADVYALGAVLFEILAREPLHARGLSALTSTIAGVTDGPAARRPELAIAPELDAACLRALALEPAARPSARELADAVQRYLDGDRDVAVRRGLSAAHLASARAALADGDPGRRVEAMREVGHAVALDPESTASLELFAQLMLRPPAVLPPGLEHALAASDIATQRRQSSVAVLSFAAIAVFLLAIVGLGVASWPLWCTIAGLTAVMALAARMLSRRSPGPRDMMLVVIGNAVLAALLSRAFGSMIVAPVVTAVMALSLTSYPQLISRGKLVIALLVASWLAPCALEWAGVVASSWQVVPGEIRSTSALIALGSPGSIAILVAVNVLEIVVIGLFANALAASRQAAQRAVEIQAWNLRQLIGAES
jgi:serine/threonine-protein kinase